MKSSVILLVEDRSLVRPVENLFLCVGFKIRVIREGGKVKGKILPDLILLNYRSHIKKIEAIEKIRSQCPSIKVVCLAVSEKSELGILLKRKGIKAIRISGDIFHQVSKRIERLMRVKSLKPKKLAPGDAQAFYDAVNRIKP